MSLDHTFFLDQNIQFILAKEFFCNRSAFEDFPSAPEPTATQDYILGLSIGHLQFPKQKQN